MDYWMVVKMVLLMVVQRVVWQVAPLVDLLAEKMDIRMVEKMAVMKATTMVAVRDMMLAVWKAGQMENMQVALLDWLLVDLTVDMKVSLSAVLMVEQKGYHLESMLVGLMVYSMVELQVDAMDQKTAEQSGAMKVELKVIQQAVLMVEQSDSMMVALTVEWLAEQKVDQKVLETVEWMDGITEGFVDVCCVGILDGCTEG